MKRKLSVVSHPNDFTNVVFLGNFSSEKYTKECGYIRIKKGVMTEQNKRNLLCYEADRKSRIVYAIIRI